MTKQHVSTRINGEPVEFLCDTHQTLLDALRDDLLRRVQRHRGRASGLRLPDAGGGGRGAHD